MIHHRNSWYDNLSDMDQQRYLYNEHLRQIEAEKRVEEILAEKERIRYQEANAIRLAMEERDRIEKEAEHLKEIEATKDYKLSEDDIRLKYKDKYPSSTVEKYIKWVKGPSDDIDKRFGTPYYEFIIQDVIDDERFNPNGLEWNEYAPRYYKNYQIRKWVSIIIWSFSSIWVPALIGLLKDGVAGFFFYVIFAGYFSLGIIYPIGLFIGFIIVPYIIKYSSDLRVVGDDSTTSAAAGAFTAYGVNDHFKRK